VSEQRLIKTEHSSAFLPLEAPLRRYPRTSRKSRPPAFLENYEDRALVYDCFWHADGQQILLVGPPPMNLSPEVRAARYEALPSRTVLVPRYYPSLSTMITSLGGAPAGTTSIVMHMGGVDYPLVVHPNHGADLAGRRVLFTMSKDNDLGWIEEWARWHSAMHATDAVVLFDNGSTRYSTGDIAATLLGVAGIQKVVVESWPYRYGMTDTAFVVNPFYVLFLQVSAMSVALRRYAAQAHGLLNCDVDELASVPSGASIFDLAHHSRHGLVVMRGRFIEPLPSSDAPREGRTHRHFVGSFKDAARALSRPNKWALDPARPWVRNLNVHPYMHWINGRPMFGKSSPDGVFYRHFRAINTNWKDRRTELNGTRPEDLVPDESFAGLVARNAF
jgi:hypothetical protein